ncbi:MAG: ABC transporter ATP-binding protein [Actinomycetota bacterium]
MTHEVLRVREVRKRFGATVALDGFDLDVRRGGLLALLGPSGCGKTTALRIIAGLERPDAGEVWVGDRRATGPGVHVPPERRRIGMVFQEGALFPHIDVAANVGFGLATGSEARVSHVLDLVGLLGLERRMPHELSGGQQQRVALARALAPGPEVILLDEPFANLDASLRARVRSEVRGILRDAAATAVIVTHDQEEALAVADHVAVMDQGSILQTGLPHEVYDAPARREVAALLGEANFLTGSVRQGTVMTALGPIPAPVASDGPVEIMVRPESIHMEPEAAAEAIVTDVEFYGHDQMVTVRLPNGSAVKCRPMGLRRDLILGTRVRLSVTGPAHFFPRRTEEMARPTGTEAADAAARRS